MEKPGAPHEPETSETVLKVRALASLKEIGAAAWDACATSAETLGAGDETHNPFVSHAFLSAL